MIFHEQSVTFLDFLLKICDSSSSPRAQGSSAEAATVAANLQTMAASSTAKASPGSSQPPVGSLCAWFAHGLRMVGPPRVPHGPPGPWVARPQKY